MKKIAFLLGSPDISGGTNVIFEHAVRINRTGVEVAILTEGSIESHRYSWHPEAGELTWMTIAEAGEIAFDIVLATWWQSVMHLASLTAKRYVYFVQSIESRFFPGRDERVFGLRDIDVLTEWCENTYRYPLPVITEATWIRDYIRNNYNRMSHLVHNGIRKDIYKTGGAVVAERQPGRLRVLVEGPLGVFYKNIEKTIELCRQAKVPEIWLLTSSNIADYPGVDRIFSQVPVWKTAEIYRSCDVLVKLSYVEGMFGPPLEMFHCGGTAIVYDVTGHDEYIRDGVNGIVIRRDDESGVVAALARLMNNPVELESLKQVALKTAAAWPDWEESAHLFNEKLCWIEENEAEQERVSLRVHNDFFMAVREDRYAARTLVRYREREMQPGAHVVNHVQVYRDEGFGIREELLAEYRSGQWRSCTISVPVSNGPIHLRIDPSVRIGIVMIRRLRVSWEVTGELIQDYSPATKWSQISYSGTATLLRMHPFPVLESTGDDPQMTLPPIDFLPGKGGLLVILEIKELSFREAFEQFSTIALSNLTFLQRVKQGLKLIMKKAVM